MKFNWGHGILSFLIGFLALCAAFIVFSVSQSHDLVTDDYYNQGANYSGQILINQRSEPYQDSINISKYENFISIDLPESILSMTDSMELFFYRPSDKSKDIKTTLKNLTESFQFKLEGLSYGRYKVRFTWTGNNEEYLVSKTLDIK